MARNEKTSKRIAAIAARGIRAPSTLTCAEIRSLCASVLTQASDRLRAPARKRRKAKRRAP